MIVAAHPHEFSMYLAAMFTVHSLGARTTLLIGDLAFMHDLSALPTLAKCATGLITVILNNGGGGIFHMLPIATHSDIFSPYFDTPHDFNFQHVCEGFRVLYARATTRQEFESAYSSALAQSGPSVIEVTTKQDSLPTLQKHMHAIASNIAHSVLEALERNGPVQILAAF